MATCNERKQISRLKTAGEFDRGREFRVGYGGFFFIYVSEMSKGYANVEEQKFADLYLAIFLITSYEGNRFTLTYFFPLKRIN